MSDSLQAAIDAGARTDALREAETMLGSGSVSELSEAVIELLMGEMAWPREEALELLRAVRPVPELIDRFAEELASGSHPERRNAARSALAAMATPTARDPSSPLPRLIDLLAHDPDADVRLLSAHALGESGNPRAREALQAALNDPHPNVIAAAAEALGDLNDPRAVDALVAVAERREFWTGSAAIAALGALKHPDAVPALSRLTSDPWLGGASARALGEIADVNGLEALRPMLEQGGDSRADAIAAAAAIVARNGGETVPAWLRDAVQADEQTLIDRFATDRDLETARLLGIAGTSRTSAVLLDRIEEEGHDAAIAGIGLLPRHLRGRDLLKRIETAGSGELASLLALLPPCDDRAAIEHVAKYLNHEQAEVRAAAAEAIGRSAEPIAIDVLQELGKDPGARLGVALAYGRMGTTRCTPILQLLRDPDSAVRAAAAEGTGRCGLGAVGELREALRRETDPTAERAIVRALGFEGGDEAVEELGRVLTRDDPVLRFEAVRALGSTGSEAAFPLLLEALSDPHPGTRTVALSALGELGDARAEEPLVRHIEDPDRDRRRIATVAIGRLFGPESIRRLEGTLRDPDREVRLVAINALAKLRLPETGSLLERVAEEDTDPLVRHTAATLAAGLQDVGGAAS